MLQTLPFNDHVKEYEAWFDKYPFVFQSEVKGIREFLPAGENLYGLEVGAGTGRFSEALGITEAVEPAENMRLKALKRGINTRNAEAEHLPYHDLSFDFVLMAYCISYFKDLHLAFKEANRVIKAGGFLLVCFVNKDSIIGKEYEARRPVSLFYKQARFYSPDKVVGELKLAGFKNFTFRQTLFHPLDEIRDIELPENGYGKGSFVIVKAVKK